MFGELGRMMPSKSSLDRLPKDLGAQWEGQREAFEAAAGRGDGGEGCEAGGWSAGYQEAGCGTLTFHDVEGGRVKDGIAWIAAIMFVVVACIPDPLPFVDEIVSWLLARMNDAAGIVSIIALIALWVFGICPPFLGLV